MAEASTNNNNSNSTSAVVVRKRSLNDFPDHILLNILSFFPASRLAAETSFLSRKWRNLWLSTSSLNFSYLNFSGSQLESNSLVALRPFADFVDRTLILRHPNSRLFTFRILFPFNNGQCTSQVNSWIRYAISRNVQNLDLDLFEIGRSIFNRDDKDCFEFLFYLLMDSHVRVLSLSDCNLSVQLTNKSTRFLSLRSISLRLVRLSDQMMVELMALCVNLEILLLSSVIGCKHVKICSFKLKELKLEFFECDEGSVEIVAPNLHLLIIRGFLVGNYSLDATSLVEARVDLQYYDYWIKFVRLLGHVKHLYTDTFWYKLGDIFKDFDPFILQNLKYVELLTRYTKDDLITLLLLLYLSPNLEMLVLNNLDGSNGETSEEDISEDFIKQLNFTIPSLRHVKIEPFMGKECEKNLIFGLLKASVVLERIELIPPKVGMTPRPPIVLDV